MTSGSSTSGARALIEVHDLVKTYDGLVVLDRFELRVERGETCVLIGGSGAGKSTFGRLLVGLERPDSGEIWVDGVDIVKLGARDLDRVRRKFSVVFQGAALLDSMSVFDNVAFPMREEMHLTEHEIRDRVHHALRELDIDGAATKLPGTLSGGMAKRVGIARALVTDPEMLVYDEPTSGLDPVSARVVDALIESMRAAHAVTSVVITHDMVTAYDVADQVVLLAHGKSVVAGPPAEVFRSHAEEIEAFTRSSGVDLATLPPRSARRSPASLRAQWERSHAP
jgi:phospholipid/cholesterol/gamma-HCH transport system ATP-binding protein